MPKAGLKTTGDPEILSSSLSLVSGIEFATVEIGVACADAAEKLRLRKLLEKYFSESLGKKIAKENFELYFLLNQDRGILDAVPSGVFIEGRYNKLSRAIAQTFHYCYKCRGRGCDFCNWKGKLSELSVQELLAKKLLPAFGSEGSKFHGCGREDVDVLMLGKGRPFVFEALFPMKRSADLKSLEKEINSEFAGKISVHGLKFCGHGRVAEVKEGEFRKIYSAKCVCDGKISKAELKALSREEIKVVQRTPERVEKRRADREREKSAKIMKVKALGETGFSVEVLASHGLYVKEFVSGDNGRTNPSVSSMLGKKCACTELDVLEIVIEK